MNEDRCREGTHRIQRQFAEDCANFKSGEQCGPSKKLKHPSSKTVPYEKTSNTGCFDGKTVVLLR